MKRSVIDRELGSSPGGKSEGPARVHVALELTKLQDYVAHSLELAPSCNVFVKHGGLSGIDARRRGVFRNDAHNLRVADLRPARRSAENQQQRREERIAQGRPHTSCAS